MKIVVVRRISQAFFLYLFVWFCLVMTIGTRWYELRGWPVNWFLQLDPLVALVTMLTTGRLLGPLAWALATVCLTLFIGRFFCGWVCPFGTLHQLVGWLAHRRQAVAERVRANRYRSAQIVKYYILVVFLAAAGVGFVFSLSSFLRRWPWLWCAFAGVPLTILAVGGSKKSAGHGGVAVRRLLGAAAVAVVVLALFSAAMRERLWGRGSLLTGLLDPIPFAHRAVNLFVLGVAEGIGGAQRYYSGAWIIGVVFVSTLALNTWIPRFFCRFICPLGALLGLLARRTPWRIGKRKPECSACRLCEVNCEGACEPSMRIRTSECVLCLNCLDVCHEDQLSYGWRHAPGSEAAGSVITRRNFLIAAVTGLTGVPALRLGGLVGPNWSPRLIRPPGALAEPEFLARCIKCGQCMRICPTNIVQPALLEAGVEGVWTPVLNYRIGTSGCLLPCVGCSNVCPTGALRPLSVDEKLGRGPYAASGPWRLGTAFVDHGRCLPWAQDTPCIVCQEVCPVTPKAIYVREIYLATRDGVRRVRAVTGKEVIVDGPALRPDRFATGDYYLRSTDTVARLRIEGNTEDTIKVEGLGGSTALPPIGSEVTVEVRLQRPYVDPGLCVGCGMCEHECPVSGLRAIRVTAENETREKGHSLVAERQ